MRATSAAEPSPPRDPARRLGGGLDNVAFASCSAFVA
jgi:hypothetical protein